MEIRNCKNRKCKKPFTVIKPAYPNKFCSHKCYTDLNKGKKRPEHSKLMTGVGNSRWKGGRILDKDGYWMVYSPKHPFRNAIKYVREHRLIMENFLGRYLLPGEVVHHKDENIKNNKLNNLQLLLKRDHDRISLELRRKKLKL